MLEQQQKLVLSPYIELYDKIIPKDNMLRRIKELIDFNFVYDELQNKYCLDNGRNAISPIIMFKYLLLKVIFVWSDVDVVEHSRYDMSIKYFLDMAPDEEVIEASSLTKFRKLRLKDSDLLDMLISKTVELSIEKGIIKTESSIIVDATHTKSKYIKKTPIEVLRELTKQLRKTVYIVDETIKKDLPEKNTENSIEKEIEYCKKLVYAINSKERIKYIPAVSEKINILNEVIEDNIEHLQMSKDMDARIGHKTADSSFFGYKTHIAMTEERIITAATVTGGEKTDGKELEKLVEKTAETGIKIKDVIGDKAYSSRENIELAETKGYNLISKLNNTVTQGLRKKEDCFEFNKDAGMYQCKAGHLAKRKTVKSEKKKRHENPTITYFFDVEKCKICPLKNGCYREGAKTKTYQETIKSYPHSKQAVFQETEYFKEKIKERYKIEAKNSELKNRHGYNKSTSYGIKNMEMQGALTIFAVNLKRIIKLLDEKDKK